MPGRVPQGVATQTVNALLTGSGTSTASSTAGLWRRRLVAALAVAVGLAALTALLYAVSIRVFAGDSDGATVVLEGQSMSAGHLTLHGWALSVDSFWGVDAVFYMLGVLVIGVRSSLLHLIPAFIASLVVLMGVLIAREGRRGFAAIAAGVTVVALLALPGRLLSYFYLRGPLHVGTTLWCLVAFFALRHRRFGAGWIVAVVFLAAGLLGDFQIVALGVAPVLVAGMVTMLRARSWRAGAPMTAAAVASVVLAFLVRKITEVIGTFSIGKLQQGASSAQMLRNFRNLVTGGARMFGVGSGPLGSGGVPKALEVVHVLGFLIVIVAVLAAIARLVLGILRGTRVQVHQARPTKDRRTTDHWLLDDLLLMAFVGGVIVFIALSSNNAFEFDRYMTSAVIFGSILAGRFVGQMVSGVNSVPVLRVVAVLGIAVVAAFSAGTGIEATNGSAAVGDYSRVSVFLEANHLDDGIGDYLDASVITVATGGKVTVRPVTGDAAERIVRYQRQSSATWYAGQVFQFLLFDTSKPGSFDSVTASLTFGSPLHSYDIGSYRVLVWSHPISVSVNGFDPG